MEQIQQVLYNLLDNAIKFSNDNSSINIETSVKNDKVFVSVKDHGVGIPKDSLSKVWDRFLQDRYLPRKRPERYRTWAFYCERDHQSS